MFISETVGLPVSARCRATGGCTSVIGCSYLTPSVLSLQEGI